MKRTLRIGMYAWTGFSPCWFWMAEVYSDPLCAGLGLACLAMAGLFFICSEAW